MPAWQTIDTAPKGEPDEWGDVRGPDLLLYLGAEKPLCVGHWSKDDYQEVGEWEGYYTEIISRESTTGIGGRPTHWMPLPEDRP